MDKRTWMSEFGDNLRSLIREEGITQQQLAKESGVDQSDISRYINGLQMPSIKAVVNLASALSCDTDDLINFDETID